MVVSWNAKYVVLHYWPFVSASTLTSFMRCFLHSISKPYSITLICLVWASLLITNVPWVCHETNKRLFFLHFFLVFVETRSQTMLIHLLFCKELGTCFQFLLYAGSSYCCNYFYFYNWVLLQISIGYFLSDIAMIFWHFPALGGLEYVSTLVEV